MADFTALKTAIQNAIKQNGNEEITGAILQEVMLAVVSTLGDSAINDLVAALNTEVTNRQNADGTLQSNINAEQSARQLADSTLQSGINNERDLRITADNALQNAINAINTKLAEGYVYVGIATTSTNPSTPSGKVFYIAVAAGSYTNFLNSSSQPLVLIQGINILKYNGTSWSVEQIWGVDDNPTAGSNKIVKSGGVFNDIMTNGSAFDLSAYNNGTTYADLNAALTALNALPADYKKGGMSLKFVRTSDNKYVQYVYTGTDTTGTPNPLLNIDNWQKVNNEPKVEIANLEINEGIWVPDDFVNTPFNNGVNNSYYSANGNPHYLATQHHIGKFYVKEGDKFAIQSWCNRSELMIAAYDIQGDIILDKSVAGESATASVIYTVPEGVHSIRIFSAKHSSIFLLPKVQFINNIFYKIDDSKKHIVENAIRFNKMNGIDITKETMTNESVVNGWNSVNSDYVWKYHSYVNHMILPTKQGEKYDYYGQSIDNCLIITAFDSNFNIITNACIVGNNTAISSGTYTVPENVSYIMFCSRKDIINPHLFCLGKGMLIDDGTRTVLTYDAKGNITSVVETTIDGVTKTRTIQYNSKQQVSSIVTVSSDKLNSSEVITYDTGNRISEINTTFTRAN